MLAPGSGCKYRLSLAERLDCTETIINQLLADSYRNPISEWQVKTSSGLPLILHYSELYNYFIIYYNVIIIEINCTINVMRLNHPKTIHPHSRPQSVEKLSSTKPVPGAKKVGDRCYSEINTKTGNFYIYYSALLLNFALMSSLIYSCHDPSILTSFIHMFKNVTECLFYARHSGRKGK